MLMKHIQSLLEKENFDSTLFPASESNLFDYLLLDLGSDSLERERIAEISYHPLETVQNHYFSIQFKIELPFKVNDLAISQSASLLHFINHLNEWPGFELDELHGKIFYRYKWLVKEPEIDLFFLRTIINATSLNLDIFSETIEQIAQGHITFNEFLEKVTQIKG